MDCCSHWKIAEPSAVVGGSGSSPCGCSSSFSSLCGKNDGSALGASVAATVATGEAGFSSSYGGCSSNALTGTGIGSGAVNLFSSAVVVSRLLARTVTLLSDRIGVGMGTELGMGLSRKRSRTFKAPDSFSSPSSLLGLLLVGSLKLIIDKDVARAGFGIRLGEVFVSCGGESWEREMLDAREVSLLLKTGLFVAGDGIFEPSALNSMRERRKISSGLVDAGGTGIPVDGSCDSV